MVEALEPARQATRDRAHHRRGLDNPPDVPMVVAIAVIDTTQTALGYLLAQP
jgi:hypothetical protein